MRHPIVQFYFDYAALKELRRTGWLNRGISREDAESVADHSYSVALLAYVVSTEYFPQLEQGKVMSMALIHDIAEVIVGDITPGDGVPLEEKHRREAEAVRRIFSGLPNAERYVSLWEEYEAGTSPEARFVKEMDRLDTVFQAAWYEQKGHTKVEDFFPWAEARIKSPELRPILEDLLRYRTEKT